MSKYIFKEVEIQEYKNLTLSKSLPLTQNYFYGEWQEAVGRPVRYFAITEENKIVATALAIKFSMPFGKSYLYMPHGPVLYTDLPDDFFGEFKYFVKKLTQNDGSVFCRFDTWGFNLQVEGSTFYLDKMFFRVPKFAYSPVFQPKFEWVIDLTQDEASIVASMKKVNRYTIRQANKNSVVVDTVSFGFMDYFEDFYKLVSKTAIRDRFIEYPKEYYFNIFKNCEENKTCFLNIARLNGEVLLVNMFIIFGDTALWLFSGSSNKERQAGYTYFAQWKAIQEAKKLGLKYYNFGGIMPSDNLYKAYRGWAGLSDFKRRFGGFQLEYSDFYDVIADKFWYAVYLLKKFFI
ncbi:MAG: peptidoglycan bridge formation glycyltransferase FemA/FemB family protein [Candidatus Vogelbacteria bacterium]|nr:peptidoglycan bridge formation glycyltransferase FemA/FemB family protein [Candidatus Vogelbacteria bacterium]